MKPSQTALALAAACALAGAAQASERAYVGVKQTFEHDSNVNRANEGLALSDWVSTTGVEGRLNLPLGLQNLSAVAEVAAQRHRDHSAFNHNPYRLGATLDWSAGRDTGLQGQVGANAASRLYVLDGALTGLSPAEERQVQAHAHVRQGLTADWAMKGGLSASRRDMDQSQLDSLNQRQWAVEIGAVHQRSPDLTWSGNLRHTRGSYPDRQPGLADDYHRNDAEAALNWRWSGAMDSDWLLGVGRETHTLIGVPDTTLWYGSANLTWRPTAKLRWQLRLDRNSDTATRMAVVAGDGGAPLPAPTPDALSNASVATGLALAMNWAMAPKLDLEARAGYVRRSLTATLAGLPADGSDSTRSASLGLRYQMLPALELGCRVAREQRSVGATSAGQPLSLPYQSNVWGCWGQFWFGRV